VKAFEITFDTNDRVVVIAKTLGEAITKANKKIKPIYAGSGGSEIRELREIGEEPSSLVL
jgi:hypothetical protein